jgi:GntR family transcriptional regulator, transcriptional repressor for pyruvate dehydrogenase complex
VDRGEEPPRQATGVTGCRWAGSEPLRGNVLSPAGTIESLPPRNTFVSDIVARLSQMIFRGEFKPGEMLPPQRELAATLGVGANTMREAIQALVGIGLVEAHPGKGTWVRADAVDTLIHPSAVRARMAGLSAQMVYETRSLVEVGLTVLAAERATDDEIARIWRAMHEMEAAVEDTEAFVRADLEFHLAVAEASHNDLLYQLYRLSNRLLEEFVLDVVDRPRVKEDALRMQRAIVQAVELHDPERARAAATEHMGLLHQLIEG